MVGGTAVGAESENTAGYCNMSDALVSTWHSVDELGEMDEQSIESQPRIRDDTLEEMFGLGNN